MRKNEEKAAFSIDFIDFQPVFYYLLLRTVRRSLRSEGLVYFCGLQTWVVHIQIPLTSVFGD